MGTKEPTWGIKMNHHNDQKDTRTLADLAREALQVQDAVNLSGVVHSFSKVMSQLHELYPEEGTEFFNTHPIAILWADKIRWLTKAMEHSEVMAAYTWANQQLIQ